MANPLFNAMNNQRPQNFDLIQQYNNFRHDPFTFMLRTKGIDIPKEYHNDPQGAVQYLLNSGQMSPEQLNYMKELAQRMGVPIN